MDPVRGSAFDAAPFGRPLEEGIGIVWDDPREVHRVVVRTAGPLPEDLSLSYWHGRWPERRLPKDRTPGGGDVGWWELGDWYNGTWQRADTECEIENGAATFTFRPLNEQEFPDETDFGPTFRTTLKLRLDGGGESSDGLGLEVYTDSTWEPHDVTVLCEAPGGKLPRFSAHNGQVAEVIEAGPARYLLRLWRTRNPDPNSFDKTLLTFSSDETVTIRVEDLAYGPIVIQDFGLAVVAGETEADYGQVASRTRIHAHPGVCETVGALPEQTWSRAWTHMVPKRKGLYLPLGTDGGRHRFRLNPDGSVHYRTNNRYLMACAAKDTPRLESDASPIQVSFGLPEGLEARTIAEGVLPIGITAWEADGIRIEQVAFATPLDGTDPEGAVPDADAVGVLMARFRFENLGDQEARAEFGIRFSAAGEAEAVRCDSDGTIRSGDRLRAVVSGDKELSSEGDGLRPGMQLAAGAEASVVVKIPYVWLEGEEVEALRALDFDSEREAVAAYWRKRMDEGMALSTGEPMLDEFHRAHAGHLLINCERSPEGDVRFARVGSFSYGAYGNESCMMIVDLDRRGYHDEARECLEAFLQGQGTVALPGDFSSQEGILYGARGYECGGYNQHHGWILWCLAEHYRFTRDDSWLQRVAPNIMAAADWVISERGRTLGRDDIGRGLLPHGSLEDIGDWWQWLSTNAYTWRGLDAAAWALGVVDHPDAGRIRNEAQAYRESIVLGFTRAAERSPVVRLRDGTSVPHYPSHVHRRGRSFGWICETLEGAIHLLIAGVIDARSTEAGWILRDFEDNLYLSDAYGYRVDDFNAEWFDRGGFSMQACLLLGVEPYLFRDEVKQALRATFNAIAANLYPDTRMLTEHALPELGDWKGDHYKSSDEANAAGWLRYMFVREQGDELLLGQAVPREWLGPGRRCGVERAATHFGSMSLIYEGDDEGITARLEGPRRNPPSRIRLRLRCLEGRDVQDVTVDGEIRPVGEEGWIDLPGDIGNATIRASY